MSAERDGEAFVRCLGSCDLWLAPRKYYLTVAETADTMGGTRAFEVEKPSRATVEPRTKAAHQGGLAMGITGIALVVLGSAAAIAGSSGGHDNGESGTNAVTGLGILGVIGGAILTPLGWVAYGRSAPAVRVESP